MNDQKREYIPDIEMEDVQVKWHWSNFDGREGSFNTEGDHNFTIILPRTTAEALAAQGWAVKENPPYEEGDDTEFTLKCKISYKYEAPKVFLMKKHSGTGEVRAVKAEQEDLSDIRRDMVDSIDVILTPSRWVQGPREGITAYVKEMYVNMRESRFASKYSDVVNI